MKPLVRLALGAALCVVAASAALAQPPQAHTPAAPAVTVVRAAERDLVERAIVTGTLVPREEILVAPEVEGYRIADVLVEEGSVVKQGQVL
ncbi:MAG: biotin/lipoyl-binding protein, partial [Microvirga sp.]